MLSSLLTSLTLPPCSWLQKNYFMDRFILTAGRARATLAACSKKAALPAGALNRQHDMMLRSICDPPAEQAALSEAHLHQGTGVLSLITHCPALHWR